MLVEIFPDYDALSYRAAELLIQQVQHKPDSVLGLATGSTPLGLYQHLIDHHRDGSLDFSKVTTFNLDEYVGLPPHHPQSYHHFMWRHLFDHLNIPERFIHIPSGMDEDVAAFCQWYEARIAAVGGIDLQVLGIGANGHLAFNEPGSSLGSRTRIKTLTEKTVRDNARFFSEGEVVPRYALTMGIGTIMESRKLLLLASGAGKADAVRAMLEGPVTAMVPATIVQLHPEAHVLIDEAAASKLAYRHHHGISEPRTRSE